MKILISTLPKDWRRPFTPPPTAMPRCAPAPPRWAKKSAQKMAPPARWRWLSAMRRISVNAYGWKSSR